MTIQSTYSTKPEKVEAVLLTKENLDEVALWCGGRSIKNPETLGENEAPIIDHLLFPTLDGPQTALVGEYVVKNSSGQFVKCPALTFEAKYTVVK